METSFTIFIAILPIFLIIGCGVLARLCGWLGRDSDLSLMKLVINLLYPALIFNFILGNNILRQPGNLIFPPLFGFVMVVFGFALSMVIAHKFEIGDRQQSNTFAFITGIQNSIYFPLPIIALLFERQTIGVLMVFNLGVEIALWLLGIGFILSPRDFKSVLQRIVSGPVVAIVVALLLNHYECDRKIPDFVFDAIRLLGQCTIPLGLILIGATLTDLKTGAQLFTNLKVPLLASVVRLVVLPAIVLFAAFFLPISTELKKVVVIQAAMPCAVFPIILTRHFDGSPEVAFKIVVSTTLLSILTAPLWIRAGILLLNL